MVRTITDSRGTEFVSRLASWQMWRDRTDGFSKVRDWTGVASGLVSGQRLIEAFEGVCPFCEGAKQIKDNVYGETLCLCTILDYQLEVAERQEAYSSTFGGHVCSLEEMDQRNDKSLIAAIQGMRHFIDHLDSWVVLLGAPGTGKSHMLQVAAKEIGPMALYISAEDFEAEVFRTLSNNTLSEMVDVIKRAPVLLLDDWGIEYGSPLPASQLRAVVNHRYKLWRELPTVITSNLKSSELTLRDARVGSRLRDAEKVKTFVIKVTDYRRKLEASNANAE